MVLLSLVGPSAVENSRIGTAKNMSNITLRGEIERFSSSRKQDPRYWGDLQKLLVQSHRSFWDWRPSPQTASCYEKTMTGDEMWNIRSMICSPEYNQIDEIWLAYPAKGAYPMAAEVNRQVIESWGKKVKMIKYSPNECGMPQSFFDQLEGVSLIDVTGADKEVIPEVSLFARERSTPLVQGTEGGGVFVLSFEKDERITKKAVRAADKLLSL